MTNYEEYKEKYYKGRVLAKKYNDLMETGIGIIIAFVLILVLTVAFVYTEEVNDKFYYGTFLVISIVLAVLFIIILIREKKYPEAIVCYNDVTDKFLVFTKERKYVEIERDDVSKTSSEVCYFYERRYLFNTEPYGYITFHLKNGEEIKTVRVTDIVESEKLILKVLLKQDVSSEEEYQ